MPIGVGIGGHHSPNSETTVWLTPWEIVDTLGPFDLDPCAAPEPRPWPTAERHIVLPEDGLKASWDHGTVFLNPPYGPPTVIDPWMQKMVEHDNGIALIFARTETDMFFRTVWGKARAILFLRGRLYFHRPDGSRATGNAGAPSVLIAYGTEMKERLKRWAYLPGRYVELR